MLAPLHLSANYQLACAILLGMALGFLLVKSDLAWRENFQAFLQLRSGRLLKTLLLVCVAGCLVFYFAHRYGLVNVRVRNSYFWTSLLGGAISGVGAALAGLVPLTVVTALAGGRFYALGALAGMLLAIPVMHWTRFFLTVFVRDWGIRLPDTVESAHFFSSANPALWICGIGLALLGIVHFALGDKE